MCGITVTTKDITDMNYVTEYLKRRGPDFTGFLKLHGYSFVHTLLSMTGDNYTYQPFYYPDDDLVIIFNGEIYNFKDFGKYNSDGECIYDVYKKYGENFSKYLDGEFAIVICDFRNKYTYYTTDIFSIKPLWVSFDGKDIGISSYESCLRRLGFKDIKEVEPNKTYKYDMKLFKVVSESTIYNFDLKQHKNSYDDWFKAFEAAILKRVINIKHRIFIGLSSGYDSGAIACCLNKYKIDYTPYSILGSENQEILKRRNELSKNGEIFDIKKDDLISQRDYLDKNCEDYNLNIDNGLMERTQIVRKEIEELRKIKNPDKKTNDLIRTLENTIIYYQKPEEIKKVSRDNGSVGLGYICSMARNKGELIYLTGSGADEILSDYGWNGVKHYGHSTIGGYFPDDLSKVFPWKNFFLNTQRAYLRKEEYVAGTYGIEGRYPFLDKKLVQEFLWLSPNLKNIKYKAPLYEYLKINNYPFDENRKIGFDIGFTNLQINEVSKNINARTEIGKTTNKALIVDKNGF